jgi:hypothetical protein
MEKKYGRLNSQNRWKGIKLKEEEETDDLDDL